MATQYVKWESSFGQFGVKKMVDGKKVKYWFFPNETQANSFMQMVNAGKHPAVADAVARGKAPPPMPAPKPSPAPQPSPGKENGKKQIIGKQKKPFFKNPYIIIPSILVIAGIIYIVAKPKK